MLTEQEQLNFFFRRNFIWCFEISLGRYTSHNWTLIPSFDSVPGYIYRTCAILCKKIIHTGVETLKKIGPKYKLVQFILVHVFHTSMPCEKNCNKVLKHIDKRIGNSWITSLLCEIPNCFCLKYMSKLICVCSTQKICSLIKVKTYDYESYSIIRSFCYNFCIWWSDMMIFDWTHCCIP